MSKRILSIFPVSTNGAPSIAQSDGLGIKGITIPKRQRCGIKNPMVQTNNFSHLPFSTTKFPLSQQYTTFWLHLSTLLDGNDFNFGSSKFI